MQICQLSCGSVFADDGADITPTSFPTLRDLGRVLDTTPSIAPRIKRRKGKRRNARNLFPSPFSGKYLEELSVPDAFDLASSVNGFSACLSFSLHLYSLHISFCELSLPSRVFFNSGSFSRSTNLEVVEDVPISLLTLPSLRPIARPHPVVFAFPTVRSLASTFYRIENLGQLRFFRVQTSRAFPFKT